MTNNTNLNISSPRGGREGAFIYLNRFLQNRNFTFGKLTIGNYTFTTMERAIPREGYSYQQRCLPPGEYRLKIQHGAVLINGSYSRQPWLVFEGVWGYPHASFVSDFNTDFKKTAPPAGTIFIGFYDSEDEFSFVTESDATLKVLVALSKVTDNDIKLIIKNNDDIEVHDYTYAEYQQLQREEQERKQREEQEAELQRLIDEASKIM